MRTMRVILIGNARLIFYLSQQYLSKGYQISVIDKDAEVCKYFADHLKALIIRGDATSPKVMEEAKAGSSQILIALSSKDHINLVCCQMGKHLFGIPETFALINDPNNYQVYKQLGINRIFNQAELIMGELHKSEETEYFHNIASYSGEALQIFEIIIQGSMPAVGIEIIALGLPRDTVVIGVIRENKLIFPGKNFILTAGDRFILAATPESIASAIRLICGERA
jgi:trk system potassium uptake protein TrkA